jgi:hypothetical protein
MAAGCFNSHPKQDADDQAADQQAGKSPANSAANSTVQSAAGAHDDDDMGFAHTLGPDSKPPAKASSTTVANRVVQPSGKEDRYAEDDRYAGVVPAPAVGNRPDVPADPPAKPAKTAAGNDGPSGVAPAMDPPTYPPKPASRPSDALPGGNPLRDPAATEFPNRPVETPVAPPPASPAASPSPTVPSPSVQGPSVQVPTVPAPAVAAPAGQGPGNHQPEQSSLPPRQPGSELVMQVKPDSTGGTQSMVPDQPAAVVPAGEKPLQPKEHGLEPEGTGPRTAKNSGVPFDPIQVNGPIFVEANGADWPKPKLALVITGNQEGYLEPCGCAGLDRMKGGMSRRYSLFHDLREKKGWPVVGLDVGNIANRFGKQAELKFQIAVNAMSEMQYSAATLGPTDLHLPTAEVMALTMPADATKKTMFVCGNVGLYTFDESLLPRTQLIKAGFKTIGVTAVLGKTYSGPLAHNADLKIISPEKLLDQAVPLLKTRANYLVLLAQADHKEAVELAQKYPDFNLVVCSDGGAEPPNKPEEIGKSGTKLVVVGEKGMYAVVLALYDNPQQPLRYQRVALDSRFTSSPQMVALMSAYQDQLKALGLSGLGIRPLANPLQQTNGNYVGSEACKSCHEESYRVWKKSPHSRAFATLKNAVPPRNFDPECISCHTVGWNPSEFFPYESGYLSEKETPKLINVGCEDCHGPGQNHCRAENQGTKTEQTLYRKVMVNTKEEMADTKSQKRTCWSCHDLDNSPEFKFDLYWPYVKHYERE